MAAETVVISKPVFLTAKWQDLVMLNYQIDPTALTRRVPHGTELDSFNGSTMVSLVAFSFLDTRVKRLPIPFHQDFEEINLRFYVRARGPEGWRRGVVFIREVVPRRAIATVARWIYNENYVCCPTRSERHDGSLTYEWRHSGEWLSVGAEYSGPAAAPLEGSEEEFITEHYWGYSVQRDGSTIEYQVEHPKWGVWPATAHVANGDFAGFYGREFGEALAVAPSSVFVANGSPIAVREGGPLELAV